MSDSGTAPPMAATVSLVSLGCSKNLVDSEVMVGHLARAGIELVGDPAESDVVVVNTCGFIEDAREESVDTILRYVELKQQGLVSGVVVTGCLVELHAKQLAAEIPEVDAFLPLSDYSGVPSIVRSVLGHGASAACPAAEGGAGTAAADDTADGADGAGRVDAPAASTSRAYETGTDAERPERPGGRMKGFDNDLGRALLTPRHTAYLRLGEGCNHVCAFCAIPKIRGKLKSKPLEVLAEEAEALVAVGARELTLIAEDSTDYGKDLGAGYGLADLLERLGGIDGLDWVRVMYAHPATIDDRLIRALGHVPNVVPYLDMPVQHGDDGVLRAMRRGTTAARIREVVGRLREEVPGITLRTTLLTGFPGETDEAHHNHLALLEELRFDRIGCFAWSPEENTEAFGLADPVPRELAVARRDEIMRWQRERVAAANAAARGTEVTVLVDAADDTLAVARRAADAPEIDGRVLVRLGGGAGDGVGVAPAATAGIATPASGDLLRVKITGAQGYDLLAVPSGEPA